MNLLVSKEAMQDMTHAAKIMAEILATKYISKEEDERLHYASKLFDNFWADVKKKNPELS